MEKGLVSKTDYITYNQDNESDCGNLSDKNSELAKVQELLSSLSRVSTDSTASVPYLRKSGGAVQVGAAILVYSSKV